MLGKLDLDVEEETLGFELGWLRLLEEGFDSLEEGWDVPVSLLLVGATPQAQSKKIEAKANNGVLFMIYPL